MRSWVLPALATTSPRGSVSSSGGKIATIFGASAEEYSTIPAAMASFGTVDRSKPSKSSSRKVARISRARSARKFAITIPSPSFNGAPSPITVGVTNSSVSSRA